MNRPKMLACACAAFLLLAFAGTASAEPVTFTLINGTGDTMTEFYASPPSTEDWEEDILGSGVLEPGEGVDITIADGREDCDYDFLAVFENEDEEWELEHNSIEICDGETYVYED